MCEAGFFLLAEFGALLAKGKTDGTIGVDLALDFQFRISKCQAYLKVYHAHQIRGYLETAATEEMLERLIASQVAVIMDWKQKFLLYLLRESMQQYFGKAGIPWHGMMFMTAGGKDGDCSCGSDGECRCKDEICVEYHDDIIANDKKEDGFAVFCSAEASILEFRQRHPERNEGLLFTDGAGCYSAKFLAMAIPELSKNTGVYITRHRTGEAGKGKTPLDGHFATAGQKCRRNVAGE